MARWHGTPMTRQQEGRVALCQPARLGQVQDGQEGAGGHQGRDGFQLVSYLTLPVGAKAKNLPLVLNVHGALGRDGWGYDPEAQWFANRGYACLQVNFRSSTGFGKKFLNAGNGQWGVGTMQHDLTDAVKWAVAKGIADPKKICIYGGSYGGYATLAGLVFTPSSIPAASTSSAPPTSRP